MALLTCARCGARIARFDERRFGPLPTASLCRACSFPAYRRPMP